MFERKKLSLVIFSLFILTLLCLTYISPWWEVSTTKENEILNGIQLKVEYWLKGSISTFIITPNYQVTALKLKGSLILGKNVTLNFQHEINSIKIPAKIDLGTFSSKFEGEADVKHNDQGYSANFVGTAKIDKTTITLNFTCEIENVSNLNEGKYPASGDLEITTSPVIISIMDLDSSENVKYELKSFLDTIWILNVVNFGINVIVFILMLSLILTDKKAFYRFLRYLLIIATIMPLIIFLLFASNIQGLISKLSNVTQTDVYTLRGSDVKTLFGGTREIAYGPSIGWKLVFVVFIMNAALLKLVNKVKGEEPSKVLNIA
jgi:hypothetical protein